MISREEARIEVAKALRDCNPKSLGLPINLAATLAEVGEPNQSLSDVLADMADSTCKLVDVEDIEVQDEELYTLRDLYKLSFNCGHSVTLHAEAKMPKYCPYCGRRVVL